MSRISIIIPTHNRVSQLLRAIDSAQKAGADVEVIVVDDASTDETARICNQLTNIKYVRLEKNVRQAAARNAGIAVSSGQFLAFLDDDDLRLPGSLDKQVEVLSTVPDAAFVYGQVLFSDPNDNTVKKDPHPKQCLTGDIFWKLLSGNFIHLPSVVVSRQRLHEIGFFDPELTGVEDWDLWLRLAECHPVTAINEPVAIYSLFTSASGQTSSNHIAMVDVTLRAQAKSLNLARPQAAQPQERKRIREQLTESLAFLLLCETQIALSERSKKRALRYFSKAFKLSVKQSNEWVAGKISARFSPGGKSSMRQNTET
jgi:hypothetical protein